MKKKCAGCRKESCDGCSLNPGKKISSIKDNPNIYPQPQSIPLPLVPDTPKMPEFYWDKFYCLSNTDILKGGAHETDF